MVLETLESNPRLVTHPTQITTITQHHTNEPTTANANSDHELGIISVNVAAKMTNSIKIGKFIESIETRKV
jgi:hypothetical protein